MLVVILAMITISSLTYIFVPMEPAQNQRQNIGGQSDLKIEVLREGGGEAITPGKIAVIHYTGTLADGTKFDSSLDRGEPLLFTLGGGQVIPGWEEGINGMKAGEKRKLTIPPELAYGAAGAPGGSIPSNATLIFEVELLSIIDPKDLPTANETP